MTILVAYSADVYGDAALEHGVVAARRSGARLLVVNATRGEALVDPRYAGDDAADAVRHRLEGLDAEFRQPMGTDVADELLTVADQEQASLLVVGIRRRTPLGKLVMGSVAQRLILEARCPVLAVKPAERSRAEAPGVGQPRRS